MSVFADALTAATIRKVDAALQKAALDGGGPLMSDGSHGIEVTLTLGKQRRRFLFSRRELAKRHSRADRHLLIMSRLGLSFAGNTTKGLTVPAPAANASEPA